MLKAALAFAKMFFAFIFATKIFASERSLLVFAYYKKSLSSKPSIPRCFRKSTNYNKYHKYLSTHIFMSNGSTLDILVFVLFVIPADRDLLVCEVKNPLNRDKHLRTNIVFSNDYVFFSLYLFF